MPASSGVGRQEAIMPPSIIATDPGSPVRFTKYWRGYRAGDVARFPIATSRELVEKRFATPYKPTKAEAEADEGRAQARRNAQAETVAMHEAAMAARRGQLAFVEK